MALVHMQNPLIQRLSLTWMDSVSYWLEVSQEAPQGPTPMRGPMRKICLRMDEFTSKDQAIRKCVVSEVLSHIAVYQLPRPTGSDAVVPKSKDVRTGGISVEVMEAALAVFGEHSQKGDQMSKSSAKTGKTFLDPADRDAIVRTVGAVPVLVAAGGVDAVLPRSLGAEF